MRINDRRGYQPMVYMQRAGQRVPVQVTAEEAGLRPEDVSPYYGMGDDVDYSQGLPTPVSGMGAVVPLLPIDAPLYQQPIETQLSYLGQFEGMSKTTFSIVAGAGGAISAVIAYLLLTNAGKWKGAGGALGYVGGGVFALTAFGSVLALVVGREALGLVAPAAPAAAPTPVPAVTPTAAPTAKTATQQAIELLRTKGPEYLKKLGIDPKAIAAKIGINV